jgi:hypothetical protein
MADDVRSRAACEAVIVLNELVRDLAVPARLVEIAKGWSAVYPEPHLAIASVLKIAGVSLVMSLYRLEELREGFLKGWLLTEAELIALGLPPLRDLLGAEAWKALAIVRHQYGGHAAAQEATDTRPARIVPAAALGRVLGQSGLYSGVLLAEARFRIAPGVERVRDEICRRHPEAEGFIHEYSTALDSAGALTREGHRDETHGVRLRSRPT